MSTTDRFANDTDGMLRWQLAEAKRRARNARGPMAAQSADRIVREISAELARRGVAR